MRTKKVTGLLLFFLCLHAAHAQLKNPAEKKPAGSVLLAWYEGRTPCREISAQLGIDAGEQCAKRKLWLMLYVDSVSKQPTTYEIGGLGARSGAGKWTREKGMPSDPDALVYRLQMAQYSLLLMKGDEQVLFILDDQKQFLPGNEKYSYTLNRVWDRTSWERWRELSHRGQSF